MTSICQDGCPPARISLRGNRKWLWAYVRRIHGCRPDVHLRRERHQKRGLIILHAWLILLFEMFSTWWACFASIANQFIIALLRKKQYLAAEDRWWKWYTVTDSPQKETEYHGEMKTYGMKGMFSYWTHRALNGCVQEQQLILQQGTPECDRAAHGAWCSIIKDAAAVNIHYCCLSVQTEGSLNMF